MIFKKKVLTTYIKLYKTVKLAPPPPYFKIKTDLSVLSNHERSFT